MTTEQRLHPASPPGPAAEPDKPKLDLSLTQVLGGALAAMTAAYLGSRLSVAGTVVGAAVASIVAAVAGSVYTASLRTTQHRVKTVFQGRVGGTSVPTTVETVPSWDLPTGTDAPAQPSAPLTAGDARRPRLPWKTVALSALGAFLLAAVALTGLELATGSSLSGEEGTTVTQVTEPQRPAPQDASPSASPSSSSPSSASATPSSTPTASSTPTTEPTPSVDSTPAPAPLPSEAAPSASSPAPVPSATAESATPAAGG
jgi:hypothetical protein